MFVIAHIFYILSLLTGLVLVPLGFPGTWLIVLSALVYSLASDFNSHSSDWVVVLIAGGLALMGELLEFGIGVVGSKKLNVSNGAILASIVGGILGAVIGVPVFLLGPLIGLLIGVFAGALAYEWYVQKDVRLALKSALGAFFSRVTALFVKTVLALGMVVYLLVKTF